MAEASQQISVFAVNVLARQAAKKAVQAELRARGDRRLVPVREMVARAKDYLAGHPELYVEARERARQIGACRSVAQTDHGARRTEKTREFAQPQSD